MCTGEQRSQSDWITPPRQRRYAIQPGLTPFPARPPSEWGQARESGQRPCAIPLPSTNGAHNPSLGYSPRKRDIETIQGLKARHHPVDSQGEGYVGPSALGSIIMADTQAVGLGFLIMRRWRSRMWGWCCALAVQERSVPRWPTAQLVQGPNVRFIPGPTAHPITAYGIAIGIGNRHDRRAPSLVSCTGFVAGIDRSGLQPSD